MPSALDVMIQKKRELKIHKLDDAILEVRDLPFTTFSHILLELFSTTRSEAISIRKKIFDSLMKITGTKEKVSNEELEAMMNMLIPVLLKIITTTDVLVERFLKDVVIDITDEHIALMPLEAVTQVITDSLSHIDLELMSKDIAQVFSQAVVVWTKMADKQKATITAKSQKTITKSEESTQ